jgi:hypothetical protein
MHFSILREVQDRLYVELLRIATGEALVYIIFPPSGKLGVGGGHATYWKPVANVREGYDRRDSKKDGWKVNQLS